MRVIHTHVGDDYRFGEEHREGVFPSGRVVRNLVCNAGSTSSIPAWGAKIPPVTGKLSLGAATGESNSWNERSHVTQLRRDTAIYMDKRKRKIDLKNRLKNENKIKKEHTEDVEPNQE